MSSPEDSGRDKTPAPALPSDSMDLPDTDPSGSPSDKASPALRPGQPVRSRPDSSLAKADADLRASWPADATAESDADLRESGEHTNIDNNLGKRLEEEYGRTAQVEQAPEPSGPGLAPPVEPPHRDPAVITAEVVEASVEIAAQPAPEPVPAKRRANLDKLGPAFPEPDIAAAFADSAVKVEPPVALPRPADAPTLARPINDKASAPARAQAAKADAKVPVDDGWSEFRDSGAGWRSPTGDSQVENKAPAPVISAPQYTRRDTNVYKLGQGPKPQEEGGARLVGIGGADNGREFPINEREMSIGRGPGNNIVLNEVSASREHARLLHEGDSYLLVDLRSANGTLVNRQKVDRARIRSGDEIGFGNARFRFLEIGDVFKPVDASGAPVLPGAHQSLWRQLRASPHFKSVATSAVILLFTLGVTAIVLVVRSGGGSARPRRDAIFQYYLQGVEAFKRRQWADAEAQFSIILGLEPTHVRGQRYLQEISRERELAGQLAAAKRSRETGDLAQAYTQAAGINDSVYTPEAMEIVRAIDVDLDGRVARAKSALEAGQAQEAQQLLDTVDVVRPGRPDVQALRDRARVVIEGAVPGKPAEATPAEPSRPELGGKKPFAKARDDGRRPTARPGDDEHDDGKPSDKKVAAAYGSGVIGKATSMFANGDVNGALKVLEAAGDGRDVQVLKAKIQKFEKVYDGAKEQHRAKHTDAAIKELKQAKAFEAKITGGDAALAEEIDRKIADMYYVQGIANYAAKAYGDAFKDFKTALSFDVNHRPSQKKLEDLADRAKEIYEEGYRAMESDSGKAKDRFRTVLQIVPVGSDYYKKAKDRLESLP
jgi:pSer/pThr/pTyr-binding forkhead associated (FHA) protein